MTNSNSTPRPHNRVARRAWEAANRAQAEATPAPPANIAPAEHAVPPEPVRAKAKSRNLLIDAIRMGTKPSSPG